MQPIPTPQVLDPDRVLGNDRGGLTVDHETRVQLLDDALHESCSYAEQLWRDLDAMRAYLLTSLPPDPRTPSPHPTDSASPTGPDDDTGWDNWTTAYAAVGSLLCAPHGDSGYGLSEGRRGANLRRTAPVLRIQAEHPARNKTLAQEDQTTEEGAETKSHVAGRSRTWRAAATIVLVLLALRGLRPRRRSHL
jgi:hypothetical protein